MHAPVELTDVTKRYGRRRRGVPALDRVSLSFGAGSFTAVLGVSGSGKSTLLQCAAGLERPSAGTVRLCGTDLAGLSQRRQAVLRRQRVGFVFQDLNLLPELTVEENIRVATYSLSRTEARTGRARALELFPELQKRLTAPARALSGGEQQMVVLAQALVSQPRYILIDELSLGLAPVVVNRLIPTIRDVAESGIGVLLIEQFVTVALGLANHAYIMEGGRIQFSGMAKELRENPELLHTAYLLRGSNGAARTPAVAGGEPTT